ncbi:flavin-containing monooxygenase-related family protein [Striga asiatica]|uniref:Flavin-containing monooxygenase-related family protein n=1 Tax=Striga asiatica TaxID=4170 RepID=A0A5A7P5J3_STRAF|nr:flavin-containing monooxygenase-related family protein [Striga asiatica]
MGFRAYPFVASGKPGRDLRRFPGHVRLGEVVRFRSEMSHVGFAEGRNWSVRSKIGNEKRGYDEVYDAVVVYNGHYTEPRVADIPGPKPPSPILFVSSKLFVAAQICFRVKATVCNSSPSNSVKQEVKTPAEVANNTNQTFQGGLIDETSSSYTGTEVGLGLKLLPPKMDAFGPSMKLGKQKGKPEREKGNSTILRFFHSHEEHLHSKTFQESGASASGTHAKKWTYWGRNY